MYAIREYLNEIAYYANNTNVDKLHELARKYLIEARIDMAQRLYESNRDRVNPELLEQNKKMIAITQTKIEEEQEKLKKLKAEYEELNLKMYNASLLYLSEQLKTKENENEQ
jgi:multidrug resistance efflux pump